MAELDFDGTMEQRRAAWKALFGDDVYEQRAKHPPDNPVCKGCGKSYGRHLPGSPRECLMHLQGSEKFKVGDRVVAVGGCERVTTGMHGVVRVLSPRTPPIGVEWEGLTTGHDLGGRCPFGRGFFVSDNLLKLEELMAAKKTVVPASIERGVTPTIILPVGMTIPTAIESLQRRQAEDEQEVVRQESFEGWHWKDVFVQVNRTLAELFGWVSPQARETFFGKTPPTSMQLEDAPGHYESYVHGLMAIPNIEGQASLYTFRDTATLAIASKQKYGDTVKLIFDTVHQKLEAQSIYRGRPIDSDFAFLHLNGITKNSLIFPQAVYRQIEAFVWTPLEQWELCEQRGHSPKRGILLSGPYGTGKTLTAYATAHVANENHWTFMYVRPEHSAQLSSLLEQALKYAPVCVFMEDVDFVSSTRDTDLNEILNTLDGVTSKSKRLMVILSTNSVDKIHPALMRPGRLDAHIALPFPDAETRARTLRYYVGEKAVAGCDFNIAAGACEDSQHDGYVGATLREVATRADLFSLSRDGQGTIFTEDLVTAADSLRAHVDLTRREVVVARPSLDEALAAVVKREVKELSDGIVGLANQIEEK